MELNEKGIFIMDIKKVYSYEYNNIENILNNLINGIYYNSNLPGHNDKGAGAVETKAQEVKAYLNMMAFRIETGNTDPFPGLDWHAFIK